MIDKNPGITCVGLLGGDQAINSILWLARCVKEHYPQLKVGWYSGKESAPLELLHDFDYVKVGPYRSEKGPLNKRTTNQIMYKREGDYWLDVTYKFWK